MFSGTGLRSYYLWPVASVAVSVTLSLMAKLTRHPSFQALKAAAPPTRVPAAVRDQAHADFEAFIRLLQRARSPKPGPSDER